MPRLCTPGLHPGLHPRSDTSPGSTPQHVLTYRHSAPALCACWEGRDAAAAAVSGGGDNTVRRVAMGKPAWLPGYGHGQGWVTLIRTPTPTPTPTPILTPTLPNPTLTLTLTPTPTR